MIFTGKDIKSRLMMAPVVPGRNPPPNRGDHGKPKIQRKVKMMKTFYKLMYWLPNQSKLYSFPQVFETEDRDDWQEAIKTAVNHGYEIEFAGKVKVDHV